MTMRRPHRRPRNRRAPLDPEIVAFLKGEAAATTPYFSSDEEIRATWDEISEEFVARWAEQRPGTRPRHWWGFDAPEPRRRVGGIGQAACEVLADAEAYQLGIPTSWVEPWHVDLYGPDFTGVAVDSEDPPVFESQAEFLRRLALALPGELERLTPADFEPEALDVTVADDVAADDEGEGEAA